MKDFDSIKKHIVIVDKYRIVFGQQLSWKQK